ncbi:MAG: type II secretion system protein M [Gammaproteobacteria bacterium]|nr:type II secretion system protein M [Gammaproteobacteria bacterium]
MKSWWLTLQPRERMTLTAAAVFIALALLYLLAVEPFLKHRANMAQRIQAKQQELIWMQQASQQVKQLRTDSSRTRRVINNRSLLSVVDSSARRQNIRKPIQRIEPEGNNGVRLWIQDANFDILVRWLGSLNTEHSVDVVRATISRTDTPGRVDSRLSLQRP